ncbi:serine/threonine-protein kinase [Streptomyces sp. KR80]|uniref:serine/threonine-protein kinase n=1 Tax=Streptomyces sp. KR80 TaxID=3457426 RepID=UPI003FD08032
MDELAAGRYRLLEVLGRGSMGEVWRAEDTTLGRQVAVKLLLETMGVPDATERFRQEARTTAGLNHPNLLAVYDFGEEQGRCYLVMELVAGHSLRAELAARSGPLDVEEACRLVGHVASGLAAAHEAGIVHRDIKPGNLLLADGSVKVADFGIARIQGAAATALTTTGEVLGTSAYLAPERGMGRAAGPEADVYALGCVLYELVCGRPPFTGDAVAAVVYQHVDAAPVPPREVRPEIPAAVESLLLRMLSKDPAARPAAAQVASWLRTAPAADLPVSLAEPKAGAAVALRQEGRIRLPRRGTVLSGTAVAAVFAASVVAGHHLSTSGDTDAATPPRTTGPAAPARPSPSPTTAWPARTGNPEPALPVQQEHTGPAAPATPSRGEAAQQTAEADKQAAEEARETAEEQRNRLEEERKKATEDARKRIEDAARAGG